MIILAVAGEYNQSANTLAIAKWLKILSHCYSSPHPPTQHNYIPPKVEKPSKTPVLKEIERNGAEVWLKGWKQEGSLLITSRL